MSPPRRPRPRIVGILLVGVLLVGAGLLHVPDTAGTEHYTKVTPAEEADVDEFETVHQFDELSADGQVIFLEAKNESGRRVTFTDLAKRPAAFDYYDDVSSGTYVRCEGSLYAVLTSKADCLGISCYRPYLETIGLLVGGFLCIGYAIIRPRPA